MKDTVVWYRDGSGYVSRIGPPGARGDLFVADADGRWRDGRGRTLTFADAAHGWPVVLDRDGRAVMVFGEAVADGEAVACEGGCGFMVTGGQGLAWRGNDDEEGQEVETLDTPGTRRDSGAAPRGGWRRKSLPEAAGGRSAAGGRGGAPPCPEAIPRQHHQEGVTMKTKTIRLTRGLPAGPRPRVIVSTDDVDSERDRVMQDGLTFRDRLRVTFAHDYRALPVGLVTGIYRFPHRTEADFTWFENDPDTARVRNIFDQGGLDASIGFQVEEQVRNELGGYDIRRARVVEFALVPVPANEGAMALAKSLSVGTRSHSTRGEDLLLPAGIGPADIVVALHSALGAAVRREVGRAALRLGLPADEPCLLIEDAGYHEPVGGGGPTLVEVTPELGQIVGTAVGRIVGHEVRRAINALRGRVD